MEKMLKEWITRLSEKRDELGGFSICPFAKKAYEDKKIYFSYITSKCDIASNGEPYITEYLKSVPEDFEVVVFFNVENNLTDADLCDMISTLQKTRNDLIFLKDHPSTPGFINGVNTGNGNYPLILVQPRSKLLEFREKLKMTSYYDWWSEEYKQEIWGYGNEC
jgi:hypothetical protein